jgi:AraC family transcriptional regulator
MNLTTLHIKNMVCSRCIKSVAGILSELNIPYTKVLLGEVILSDPVDAEKEILNEKLKAEGFEIIDDRKSQIISQMKNVIVEYVQKLDSGKEKPNLTKYLSETLHYDYTYLSSLFSSVEGQTVEKYLIAQKIEKAKELLVYDELTISEIAYKLGYSSVAHLSNQFKQVTGLTPTHFKSIGAAKRISLDSI